MVFIQATFDPFRNLLGVQFDLLPGLMVYCSLSAGLFTITALALVGGLCLDSLSSNPLGVSVLPLFIIGFSIQLYRSLIVRDQYFTQLTLGLAASALMPLLTLLLLLHGDRQPIIGLGSLWHWVLVTLVGGMTTPIWFLILTKASNAVNYRPITESSFRPDREIKRGRF